MGLFRKKRKKKPLPPAPTTPTGIPLVAPPSARVHEIPLEEQATPLVQWEQTQGPPPGAYGPQPGAQRRETGSQRDYEQYEIGNAAYAQALREAFDLTGGGRFALASEIVPVVTLDLSKAGALDAREWIAGARLLGGAAGYRDYIEIINDGPLDQIIDAIDVWPSGEVWAHLLGAPLGGFAIGGLGVETVTFPVRIKSDPLLSSVRIRGGQSRDIDSPPTPPNNGANAWLVNPPIGTVARNSLRPPLGILLPSGKTFALISNDNLAISATFQGHEVTT